MPCVGADHDVRARPGEAATCECGLLTVTVNAGLLADVVVAQVLRRLLVACRAFWNVMTSRPVVFGVAFVGCDVDVQASGALVVGVDRLDELPAILDSRAVYVRPRRALDGFTRQQLRRAQRSLGVN